jgi:hypothetical protein
MRFAHIALTELYRIKVEDVSRFIDKGFNAKEYYKNVIGITVPGDDPVEIHLNFTKEQAQYVITQPLLSSQELVRENKNTIVFKYFLVPNFEFMAQVLGWGE